MSMVLYISRYYKLAPNAIIETRPDSFGLTLTRGMSWQTGFIASLRRPFRPSFGAGSWLGKRTCPSEAQLFWLPITWELWDRLPRQLVCLGGYIPGWLLRWWMQTLPPITCAWISLRRNYIFVCPSACGWLRHSRKLPCHS